MRVEVIKFMDMPHRSNNKMYRVRVWLDEQLPRMIDIFGYKDLHITKNNLITDFSGKYIILTVHSTTLSRYLNIRDIELLKKTKDKIWTYVGDL